MRRTSLHYQSNLLDKIVLINPFTFFVLSIAQCIIPHRNENIANGTTGLLLGTFDGMRAENGIWAETG
jgi:hypothetical protein